MSKPPLGIMARAIVDRVIDGDTVDVLLTIPVRVRLLDCWAPEITGQDKANGLRSKVAMQRLVEPGDKVRVHVPTGEVDAMAGVLTFGRVLGNIYREGDRETLSELMVAAGMASPVKVVSDVDTD
jgi:endonuclease YncB( thermonuclease family)